jgi:hypothetical protein
VTVAWRKQGIVLAPPLGLPWSRSHVALPTVDPNGQTLYFSTRDQNARSWIGRASIDLSGRRPRVAGLDPEPVLAPGALGAFDDAGVTPSCVVVVGDERRLYYTGWSLGVSVPFYLAIGMATSRDGGQFERVSVAPVLGRTAADPYLTASPHVLRDGDRWRMWYVSGQRWSRHGDEVRHHYHLRHGESHDGIQWQTDRQPCVDFADEREYAFSRPCVLRREHEFEMWYSVRGVAYELGYARSVDGLRWDRDDSAAGLERSATGWDSEMIAYPHVFDHHGTRFMLYNGNGYGATGIGGAVRIGS